MKNLSIDLECYSDVDLSKCGVYKYAESPSFEILLFGYAVDGGEVRVIDLASGEKIPDEILDALTDDDVIKWAFNANFERICLSRYLRDRGVSLDPFYDHHPLTAEPARFLNPSGWHCSMVWAATLGLPLSLKGAGAVLNLEDQKMDEGKALIKYFSLPCAPTKANGGRRRNLPSDASDRWETFKRYNKRDVEVEMAIQKRLSHFPVPDFVWDEYTIDQEINDRGVRLDMDLVRQAIRMDELSKEEITGELKNLTGLENPNSVMQLKAWLEEKGFPLESLGKKEVAAAIKEAPDGIKEVLALRLQLAKSSVKKYQTMERAVCSDGRARGMFMFYGANRTGRWAGRLVQLQNLPQNHLPDLSEARALVRSGDFDSVKLLYEDVPDTLSQLIRTAFIPRESQKFYVADFSAIEARVIAWYAGESWKSEAFANGEDIYCSTASRMFGVPVVKHGVNGGLRQKGKIAELACIAEGEPVLTSHGLKPIETVTKEDLLWDGESWVRHDGVIYKGRKEVITYEGLRATGDHLVFVEGEDKPIRFLEAARSSAHLVQSGVCPHNQMKKPALYGGRVRVYDIRNAGEHHRFTVSGKLVHNCGYGGSTGALKAMGAIEMGLSEDELPGIVSSWRSANKQIVRFWWEVDRAVKDAVKYHKTTRLGRLTFFCQSGMLFITLPSGRKLAYARPRIGVNRFGGECVTYEGTGSTRKWERLESYGPKFVENIVQATSRDILCNSMKTLRNCSIVMHIHDELVIEADPAVSLKALCEQMGRTPSWAPGLVLRADGYTCEFYQKD
jgi:DNA polymerase